MNCRFYIRAIEGGTYKEFGFSNFKMGIQEQIDTARRVIAKKYSVDVKDVEFEDFTYGGNFEWIKI